MKRIIAFVCNLLAVMILIAVILTAGSVLTMQILGYKPMAVLSGSMSPTYNIGALVFVDTNAKPESVKVGDVITFEKEDSEPVTHRVISVDEESKTFQTKGDAVKIEDGIPIEHEDFIGKALNFEVPRAGDLLMQLPTKTGFAAGLILIAVLLMLFIVAALMAPPKEKAEK